MMNSHFNKPILFLIPLLMANSLPTMAAADQGKIKCWVNDDGVTECGNYIPPKFSQQGFSEFNQEGQLVDKVKRAPTPEEIAEFERQEKEEQEKEEQLKKDRALLALFSTEKDIEMARTAELNTIDGQIQSIETILNGLKGNLVDLEDSYERSKNNPSVSQSQLNAIESNIDSAKKRIKDTDETLNKKINERLEANQKYDTYLQRYQDIIQRRGHVLPPATKE